MNKPLINKKRWQLAGIEVAQFLSGDKKDLTFCEGVYYPRLGGVVLPDMLAREARFGDPYACLWLLQQQCAVPAREPSPENLEQWLGFLRRHLDKNRSLQKVARVVALPAGGWAVAPHREQGELVIALRRSNLPLSMDNIARARWRGLRLDASEPKCPLIP